MKLEVSKAELLRAMEVAVRAVNSKSPLPIYSALMLEVNEPKAVQITGTDGELTLTATAALNLGDVEVGKVAVISEAFVSVVKGLPGPDISMATEKNALVVKSKRSRYAVPILTGEQWPVVPRVAAESTFTVHEKALANQLARVLPAVGIDSSRQVICGVYFALEDGRLSLVATDTHRLHVARVPVPKSSGDVSFILGTGAAKELSKLLAADNDCQVTTDGACLKIVGSWGSFTSRLIAGNYLNYQKFIPTMTVYTEFDRGELEEAIRRAAFVAQGCADRLVVTQNDKAQVSLEAASEQYGTAEEQLFVRGGEASAQQFAISARNLGAAVGAVPSEVVRLYRSPEQRAILVAGEDTETYFGVVIPMRLPSDD